MISGNISHENATDQLIREYIMRRVGGLEKEEIPVKKRIIKTQSKVYKQMSISPWKPKGRVVP